MMLFSSEFPHLFLVPGTVTVINGSDSLLAAITGKHTPPSAILHAAPSNQWSQSDGHYLKVHTHTHTHTNGISPHSFLSHMNLGDFQRIYAKRAIQSANRANIPPLL